MSKKMHKSRQFPLPLKIAVIVFTVLILLCFMLYAFAVVAVRSSDDSFREKLCGTLVEKDVFFTDWLFTTKEIRNSTLYTPPAEALSTAQSKPASDQLSAFTVGNGENGRVTISSDNWTACVLEVVSSSLVLKTDADGYSGKGLEIGLCEYPEMIFRNECLSYTGEGGTYSYCFCGVDESGKLHIGAVTASVAVNGRYKLGFSCERVLVSGGVPCTGLAGGYNGRVAIGQRDDGSVFLLTVKPNGSLFNYPCGITYDTLAYIMYAEGAVNAAALPVAGNTNCDGRTVANFGGKTGYVLVADTTD